MIVKICGITRTEDALVAAGAGADAIGFVFWPSSPRFIDPYRALAIAAAMPPFVTLVGVFVNQTPAYMNGVASLVGLGAVQLHGDETPEVLDQLRRPAIRAVSIDAGVGDVTRGWKEDDWPDRVVLLADVRDPVNRGGTGRLVDWGAAGLLASRRRVLLAGGLTPENVMAAIGQVRPFGVDVSSGVERSPGIKDPARVRAFIAEAVSYTHLTLPTKA